MHYIGKSYETTVYKCDDEKIDRFLEQIFSDDSENGVTSVYKCITKGKSYVTTVYKCDDGKKSDDSEKKCDKCIQMH